MPSGPAEAELRRLEEKSEAAYRARRSACCRGPAGELETTRSIDAAPGDMEAAVIAAGNAHRKLRLQ